MRYRKPRKPYEFDVKNGCFECTSHAFDKDGYPIVKRNKIMRRLSHIIFEECFRFLKEGEIILHTCDNPTCINPEHLKAGSKKENSLDMINKGRSLKGSTNPAAKLTEDEVIEAKKLRFEGFLYRELADKYGVSITTINQAVRGLKWNV